MEKQTFGARVKQVRKAAGLTQKQLAQRAGISQPTVAYIERERNSKSTAAVQLARVLNVSAEWLVSGDGSGPAGQANVRRGPAIRGLVPLISSVQAGEWAEIADNFQPGDADVWLPCPAKHGQHTFCLVVEGESMKNPGAKPSYDPGDILFVDPDAEVKPGDRVIVRLDNQDKATFKQYLEEDGVKRLKALNPDWTPRYIDIAENAHIVGVVIGKWVSE
jgi:SOS-response transcriptional repressor LexA